MSVLYHSTSDINAEAIGRQGVCADRGLVAKAIYASPNPWIAELYGGSFLHDYLHELGITDPAIYAQEFYKHSSDVYRFDTAHLPSRCRVRPDPALKESVKITGCQCIPPELLERCRIPRTEEGVLGSGRDMLTYCLGRWVSVRKGME